MYHFNSESRTSGTLSQPVFLLEDPIADALGFRIHNVQIPHTYYNITTANNHLRLEDAVSATTYIVTLTPGNYSASSLATALQTAINAAATTASGSPNFTVTYSATTHKYTLANALHLWTLYEYVGDAAGAANSLLVLIGDTAYDHGVGGVNSHTFANAANINVDNRITLASSALSRGLRKPATVGTARERLTLAKIPLAEGFGFVEKWEPTGYTLLFASPQRLYGEIDLRLYDSGGRSLNLNGLGWSMTIEVLC